MNDCSFFFFFTHKQGFFIFLNQSCFIIGIKLSNAVAASIWQPSQPIITAAICMFMGWEDFSVMRLIGIIIAFAGCATMVALSSNSTSSNDIGSEIAGNLFFFFNCLGTALYVIFSKKALVVFPSICVTVKASLLSSLKCPIPLSASFFPLSHFL
jgi:drug/metabolite transporter (DMT)-like permease